jgi:putative membrane protein
MDHLAPGLDPAAADGGAIGWAAALQPTLHAEAWLLAIVLLGGSAYLRATLGPRLAPAHLARHRHATPQQKRLFTAGVLLLLLGAGWPIHALGEDHLYSVHMVQHLLFQLGAAPLLILGTPAWLLRHLLARPRVAAVVRLLTRPLHAIILIGAFMAVAHTPGWVDLSVTNGLFHLGTHVLWLVVGFIMWWPVLSPLPELPHLSYIGRMGYLFSHSIVPTVPASFLTFAHHPFYESYVGVPRVVEFLTPIVDLQIAGLLMKIGGGLVLWTCIAVLFFKWAGEDRSGGPDFLYWRDYAGTERIPELTSP